MSEQAIIETEKSPPHGGKEPVPVRSGGNNEQIIDDRRERYGETPRFNINNITSTQIVETNVNQVDTPNNPTKQKAIEKYDGFYNHSMCP